MTDGGPYGQAAPRQLGEALRGVQRRSGHTLRELEKRVPVSDSSLSRYFRGDAVPSWPVVLTICRALGADPGEFRALWEAAADRARPEPLPAVPAPTPAPPPPVPAWRRLAYRTGRSGRRVWATAGVLTGALLGAALTPYVPQQAAESAQSGRGVVVAKGAARRAVFHEAEKARRNNVVVREAVGALGGRAVARMDYPDSYVEFVVVADSAGPRSLSVRFSNGSQDSGGGPASASHNLSVNGTAANPVHYPHTGWENWQKTEAVTVVLHEGRNSIRFSKGDLYAELDGVELA